jgi:predicted deacetylase
MLASIHDVSPRFTDKIDRLADRLSNHLGGPRFALLVVPDHWGEAPIDGDRYFQGRVRDWHNAGAEVFVHGWYHRDFATHRGVAAFKAKHMTAREGEFLGLDHATALERMLRGKALIEDIIGAPASGFIAPAWLYGTGARSALAISGFAIAEDHMRVWVPATGHVLARGPVITWASRNPRRILSSRMFAALARHALSAADVVRVAVHPGDASVPALLESIDATLGRLMRNRIASRYGDLLTP